MRGRNSCSVNIDNRFIDLDLYFLSVNYVNTIFTSLLIVFLAWNRSALGSQYILQKQVVHRTCSVNYHPLTGQVSPFFAVFGSCVKEIIYLYIFSTFSTTNRAF